jgi:hypothetical protein
MPFFRQASPCPNVKQDEQQSPGIDFMKHISAEKFDPRILAKFDFLKITHRFKIYATSHVP